MVRKKALKLRVKPVTHDACFSCWIACV